MSFLTETQNKNAGDTIVEVLFAISIFSLVAVGALSIMNKGTAIAQNAIEATMVRQQIDAQVETLRFLNASYLASYNSFNSYPADSSPQKWYDLSRKIATSGVTSVSNFGSCLSGTISNKYAIDINTATFKELNASIYSQAVTYAKIDSPPFKSYGIWIEAIRSNDGSDSQAHTGYIDFYIYACWGAIGQSVPATDGTIVRLYEPR